MKILVIGCASQDRIHLELANKSFSTAGGAGLYTALAARAAGADVTLLAPVPDFKLSDNLPSSGFHWIGPETTQENFPRLEIVHHGSDRATLLGASWGAESELVPSLLPSNLSEFDIVHIAALCSAKRQLEFLRAIRARCASKVSVGTYAKLAYGETESVRELFSLSNFAFLNENESKAVFDENAFPLTPREDQIMCITRGKNGASVYSAQDAFHLAACSVIELDPTGAGDTFAGTFLASADNQSIEQITKLAIERAALNIAHEGPSAILNIIGSV